MDARRYKKINNTYYSVRHKTPVSSPDTSFSVANERERDARHHNVKSEDLNQFIYQT
jgi:hypothetical protein